MGIIFILNGPGYSIGMEITQMTEIAQGEIQLSAGPLVDLHVVPLQIYPVRVVLSQCSVVLEKQRYYADSRVVCLIASLHCINNVYGPEHFHSSFSAHQGMQ